MKKAMKIVFAVLAVLLVVGMLPACGGESVPTPTPTAAPTPTPIAEPQPTPTPRPALLDDPAVVWGGEEPEGWYNYGNTYHWPGEMRPGPVLYTAWEGQAKDTPIAFFIGQSAFSFVSTKFPFDLERLHIARELDPERELLELIAAYGKVCGLAGSQEAHDAIWAYIADFEQEHAGQEEYLAAAEDFRLSWMAQQCEGVRQMMVECGFTPVYTVEEAVAEDSLRAMERKMLLFVATVGELEDIFYTQLPGTFRWEYLMHSCSHPDEWE